MRFAAAPLVALAASLATTTTMAAPTEVDVSSNTTLVARTPPHPIHLGEQWHLPANLPPKDPQKLTVYTFGAHESCDNRKWARVQAFLEPWKCKSFGFGSRFAEVMFELPEVVYEKDIYCELSFYEGDGCGHGEGATPDPQPRSKS